MTKVVTLKIDKCTKCPFCTTVYDFDDDGDDWNLFCNKQNKFVSRYLKQRELESYSKIDKDCPLEDDEVTTEDC